MCLLLNISSLLLNCQGVVKLDGDGGFHMVSVDPLPHGLGGHNGGLISGGSFSGGYNDLTALSNANTVNTNNKR